MLTLEMSLHLTLHLEQARNIDPLVSSLVLIILERPSFLEQLFYMMKHLTPLNNSLTQF
jgi:hypothetical protein